MSAIKKGSSTIQQKLNAGNNFALEIESTQKNEVRIDSEHFKSDLLIGVDPGQKGAIACIDKKKKILLFAFNFSLQTLWGHDVVDLVEARKTLINELSYLRRDYPIVVFEQIDLVLERVSSYGQGVTSAFDFGCNSLGLINGFKLMGFNVLPSVRPQDWKNAMGLHGTQKRASLEVCNKIFTKDNSYIPEFSLQETTNENDSVIGCCEAALIALYASNCKIRKKA